jgi:hypothetical protein
MESRKLRILPMPLLLMLPETHHAFENMHCGVRLVGRHSHAATPAEGHKTRFTTNV